MKKQEFIERYGEEAYKRFLGQQKQYYQQHREEKKQYQKQYKEQHREEIKEYNKQYMRKYNSMFAFCIPEEIQQIENYELAKKDNFKGWHIHHRLECVETGAVVNSSRQDLIDWGIYYNRPASELIFLTASEHKKIHNRAKKYLIS